MKMSSNLLAVLFTAIVLKCATEASPAEDVSSDIQKHLPNGWSCTLISEKGTMGHPHGLAEPLFRLDFTNANLVFQAEAVKGQQYEPIHSSLRLHFHAKAEREAVLKTIKAEQLYSWDIPILFAETQDYLIVTSPGWQNHGVYTAAANDVIAPLLQALKRYCDAKK
jgi:hypothetical protein